MEWNEKKEVISLKLHREIFFSTYFFSFSEHQYPWQMRIRKDEKFPVFSASGKKTQKSLKRYFPVIYSYFIFFHLMPLRAFHVTMGKKSRSGLNCFVCARAFFSAQVVKMKQITFVNKTNSVLFLFEKRLSFISFHFKWYPILCMTNYTFFQHILRVYSFCTDRTVVFNNSIKKKKTNNMKKLSFLKFEKRFFFLLSVVVSFCWLVVCFYFLL